MAENLPKQPKLANTAMIGPKDPKIGPKGRKGRSQDAQSKICNKLQCE